MENDEMIEKILLGIAIELIKQAGPVIIKLILNWLESLSNEKKVAFMTSLQDGLKKAA